MCTNLNIARYAIFFILVNPLLIFCFNETFLYFARDGTSIILSDDVGQLYILNTGQGESQMDAKYDQVVMHFVKHPPPPSHSKKRWGTLLKKKKKKKKKKK